MKQTTKKHVVFYCETYKIFVQDLDRESIHDHWGCCTEINRFDSEAKAGKLVRFLNEVCNETDD